MEYEDLDQVSTFSEANRAQNISALGCPDELQNQEVAVPDFELRNDKPVIRVNLVQNAEFEVMPAYRRKVRDAAFPGPVLGGKWEIRRNVRVGMTPHY